MKSKNNMIHWLQIVILVLLPACETQKTKLTVDEFDSLPPGEKIDYFNELGDADSVDLFAKLASGRLFVVPPVYTVFFSDDGCLFLLKTWQQPPPAQGNDVQDGFHGTGRWSTTDVGTLSLHALEGEYLSRLSIEGVQIYRVGAEIGSGNDIVALTLYDQDGLPQLTVEHGWTRPAAWKDVSKSPEPDCKTL